VSTSIYTNDVQSILRSPIVYCYDAVPLSFIAACPLVRVRALAGTLHRAEGGCIEDDSFSYLGLCRAEGGCIKDDSFSYLFVLGSKTETRPHKVCLTFGSDLRCTV
jgi:hypothetical protein